MGFGFRVQGVSCSLHFGVRVSDSGLEFQAPHEKKPWPPIALAVKRFRVCDQNGDGYSDRDSVSNRHHADRVAGEEASERGRFWVEEVSEGFG